MSAARCHLVMFVDRIDSANAKAVVVDTTLDAKGDPDANLLATMLSTVYLVKVMCGSGIAAWSSATPDDSAWIVERCDDSVTWVRGEPVFCVPDPASPEDSVARVLRIAEPLPQSRSTASARRVPTH